MANILFVKDQPTESASETSIKTFWENGGANSVIVGTANALTEGEIDAAEIVVLSPLTDSTSTAINTYIKNAVKPVVTYNSSFGSTRLSMSAGAGAPPQSQCLVVDGSPLIGSLLQANNPHDYWNVSQTQATLETVASGLIVGAKHTSGTDRTLVAHVPLGATLSDASPAAGLRVYFNWCNSSTLELSDLAADGTTMHEATRTYVESQLAPANDIEDVIYSDAAQTIPIPSRTFDYWIVDATSPDGTVTTDGSGNFTIPEGTLTPGDKVMITRDQTLTDNLSVEAYTVT